MVRFYKIFTITIYEIQIRATQMRVWSISISTADMCNPYNCSKNGKGFKIGTEEADTIEINNRLGAF